MKQRAQTDRRALTRTSGLFMRCLGKLVDPRLWVRRYPIQGVGAAAAAGFFASGSLARKEREKAGGKPARKEALSSVLTMLLMTGADILKSVGTSFLMEKIKSKGIKEAPQAPSPKTSK